MVKEKKKTERKAILVRMEPEVFNEIRELAKGEERSMNQQMIFLMKRGMKTIKG